VVRRKKRDEKKKMSKKMGKDGKLHIESAANKDEEENEEINFEDYDYNFKVPKAIKKTVVMNKIVDENVEEEQTAIKNNIIEEEKKKFFDYDDEEEVSEYSDREVDEYFEELENQSKQKEEVPVVSDGPKVKELPKNVIIDTDL